MAISNEDLQNINGRDFGNSLESVCEDLASRDPRDVEAIAEEHYPNLSEIRENAYRVLLENGYSEEVTRGLIQGGTLLFLTLCKLADKKV